MYGWRKPSEGWVSTKYDLQSMSKDEIIPELFHRDGVTPLTLGDAANFLKKSWKAYRIAGAKGEPRTDIALKILDIQEKLGIEQSDFPEVGDGWAEEESEDDYW